MVPTGLMFPHGRPDVTGGPMSVRCQITAPVAGVERINIIRCGNSNDHRPVRPALDVKRLRMNVAHDRAIKVQIADQIGRIARRKCGIDIKTVPGRIIVFLRDVDLRAGTRNDSAQREHENCDNENETFHMPAKMPLPLSFYNSMLTCLSRI